jgi:NAD+ synthase (glutamine-hydrolysing)
MASLCVPVPAFEGQAAEVTEESMQARCRGIVPMALSDKQGRIRLPTGNKGEISVGCHTR